MPNTQAVKADYLKRIRNAVQTYISHREQRERRNRWKPTPRTRRGNHEPDARSKALSHLDLSESSRGRPLLRRVSPTRGADRQGHE
jgi:hypothetical protein